ncbi:MAG: PstS family phosphate ABC transporter substrate-binding protein, partial [bacterium]
SGTGGGMKRFTIGEIDITGASRSIKDSEAATAAESGIEYTRFEIAMDGITVVINPENNWANNLTVEELKKIWEPNSTVKTWSDVRPEWPNEEIELFAPGSDSGTFDYFTKVIVGEASHSRSDYTASEDDNVLVQGVAGNKYALGYFGYAYYAENMDILKAAAVNGVLPASETVGSGKYKPLSRPIFIYINNEAVKRPEVEGFLRFYFDQASELVPPTGYVDLTSYQEQIDKVDKLIK